MAEALLSIDRCVDHQNNNLPNIRLAVDNPPLILNLYRVVLLTQVWSSTTRETDTEVCSSSAAAT